MMSIFTAKESMSSISQIKEIKDLFNEIQRAVRIKEKVPPQTNQFIGCGFTTRATPPVIRLGAGYVTSLVFRQHGHHAHQGL